MNAQLSVAAPWSLTHYMPLNGFHPLYRALFESVPEWVRISAWDNVELSQRLRGDEVFRARVIGECAKDAVKEKPDGLIQQRRLEYFKSANLSLTRLLPGDIEFHHTAPFPSFERPFVFHCEAFAPIFLPLAHQGSGGFVGCDIQALRDHYREIFEHPLCLGIFSHIPQTLEDISRFFLSPRIDGKLFSSRIGMHGSDAIPACSIKNELSAPIFLFVNSANQNPKNFVLRGGHIVLRYWQRIFPDLGAGRLIMRCSRPLDAELCSYGVDLAWLRRHEGKSVIWIENYLTDAELTSLMQAAHFLLLPSMSLHSVSIMSAMAAGAVPIVSDTVGTDRYVSDAFDGVVLRGVYDQNWIHDSETGIMFNCFDRSLDLEEEIIEQLVSRIGFLLNSDEEYRRLQQGALSKAREEFSGTHFSEDFWGKVQQCYHSYIQGSSSLSKLKATGEKWLEVASCFVTKEDWPRLFTSTPQPVTRLDAGSGRVTELGGCLVFTPRGGSTALHHWSPVASYLDEAAPQLSFSSTIKGLGGCYLAAPSAEFAPHEPSKVVIYVSRVLMPYPRLFSVASLALRWLRRAKGLAKSGFSRKVREEKPGSVHLTVDIELIAENLGGLNIIRHGHMFYGVLPSAGEFVPALAQSGKYEPCLIGTSLKEILLKIETLRDGRCLELLEIGVGGFNIVRYADVVYAIPASEGDFDFARVQAGSYSCVHSGKSLDMVKAAIFEGAR